ncbi:homoserine kinase [Quadrisphaera granulorum]|uniref:Homoserine kinase n=1 Tax=Quadrisphaera granulorum TaxID=317664 RepID=A0A316AH71_9ACTN|nr:homoserine kinase [Quadrisphaera granulorum]PWJ56280.1 homoserine kinase [Quadrisphaera granulorum]SZE94914.1 homoserine kinase [Quadrisphaera granulorum]
MSAPVVGRRVRVVVPGSSANLGPGFDALGLALGLRDEVHVEVLPGATNGVPSAHVQVSGEGAESIAGGEGNLLVRSVRAAFHAAGVLQSDQPHLRVSSCNGVPHGRGVGSSAAAVVAGAAAGSALLDQPLAPERLLDLVCGLEGHPDNAAASLLGGFTLGWRESAHGAWRAVRVDPHDDVVPLLCVPGVELSTARARAMLPLHVPHGDAAHTAGRAALLVEAMTRRPDLLLAATEDRLHQEQRAAAMPESAALLADLRGAGHAAVVSGAGPSVLVLCPSSEAAARAQDLVRAHEGWTVHAPGVDRRGADVAVHTA